MPLIKMSGSTSIHSSREKPASLRPEVNDKLPAIDGHSISDEHVVENTFINKTAVNTDIYSDNTTLIAGFPEGRVLTVTYFSQTHSPTDVQSAVVDLTSNTKDDVHVAWTQIRNFEIRARNELAFSYDVDTNNTDFKGEGIVFPRFEPKIGDLFIYEVRNGKYGVFYISSVERLALGQDTYHAIQFTMQAYLSPDYRDRLAKQTTQIMYFDKTKYMVGNSAMLTSEGYANKKDLLHLRSEIIEDYMERFYSPEFSTFMRPDEIYDPYVVEYWNTKISITESMKQVRPTQILISVSNFKKTIWALLTNHPIKDLNHLDKYSNTDEFKSTFWGTNITSLLGHKFLTVGNEAPSYDWRQIDKHGEPIFYDPTTIYYQRTPYDQVQKRVDRFFRKRRKEFFDMIYPDLGFKYHHLYTQQHYPIHSDEELVYIWKMMHGYAEDDVLTDADRQHVRGYIQWYRESYPGTLSDIELTNQFLERYGLADVSLLTDADRQKLIAYIASYRSKYSTPANPEILPDDTGKLNFLYYPIFRDRDKKQPDEVEQQVNTDTYALSYAFYTGDWDKMSTIEQLLYTAITNGELNINLIVDVVKDYLSYSDEDAYYNHLFLIYLIDKAVYWLTYH
jgi:hypothetical protein